jgi:hypothetical protein
MARLWLVLGLGVLAGCTGIIETFGTDDPMGPDAMETPDSMVDASCVPPADDQAPAKPTVLTPTPVSGKPLLVEPAGISITASAFSDPDVGDAFGTAIVEILGEENGAPTGVVWRATITDPAKLTSGVTLADGDFIVTELFPWTDYFVQVRYTSNRAPCGVEGANSDPVLFKTDDNSSYLFDDTVVREIRLYITEPSWTAINDQAIVQGGCVPWSRDYHTADLVFEGIRYNGVGVHVKGGCGSDRQLHQKASFKVGLKWDDPAIEGCSTNSRLLGQTHLTLNNGVQDCSHEHERLAYRMYQAMGVPTPRQAHVRLYVNDMYWGVYLNLESFDRRMMTRVFGDDRGMLYEGTYGCDLSMGDLENDINSKRCDTEFKQDACDDPPEPGQDPTDFTPLRTFVQQLDQIPAGQFYPDAGQYLDMDEWLSLYAVNAAIDHWDDTFRGGNNYRMYHDVVSGKWKLLSSGVDQTFASERFKWWREINHTFAAKCFSERDCINAFEAKLEIAQGLLTSLNLQSFADTIHERNRPYAETDPRRECDNATWDQRHTDLKDWITRRTLRLPVIRKSDTFQVGDELSIWSTLSTTPTANFSVANGALQIQQTAVGRWNNAERGKFVYKDMTGDFRVHVRVRAEREGGGQTDQNNTWAGVMLRNPDATDGEDYAFIGVGRDTGGNIRIIRSSTADNVSTETVGGSNWDYPGTSFDAQAELRICRVGNQIRVMKYFWNTVPNPDRFEWTTEATFTQPGDFGANLQAGFMTSAADVTPTFRGYVEWVDFQPITDINECDDT